MKISEHYSVHSPVPFADVDVASDNRLFLDPHAIRLSGTPQPFADEAIGALDRFLLEIVRCVVSPDPAQRRRGERLLQHFKEPWETRFGLSAAGYFGHGGADDIGARIWEGMADSLPALIEIGVLSRLEQLPLFIEGVGNDITSDITTRITFAALARFTESVLADFPEFSRDGHHTKVFECQVWNADSLAWDEQRFTLPVADGRALLLVPREWARATLLMSPRRYFEKTILDFAQAETTVLGADGTVFKTNKDDLKKLDWLAPGRGTNIRVTLEAHAKDEDLIANFEAFVASKFGTDDEGPEDLAA